MTRLKSSIAYGKGTIVFSVIYTRRTTLEIAVYPDKTVIVKAPLGTDFPVIEKKVLKRAAWIIRQIDYFAQFDPRTPPRHYIGGETHLYLGRSYRLKICSGDANQVKLIGGYFQVCVKGEISEAHVKHLLDHWYKQKAIVRFSECFDHCWPYFEKLSIIKPRIQIRKMQKRWGSLSKNGILTLNTDLIRAPRECIDYVITHELCHLKYHDHGPGFYRQLEKVMPDWEKRKMKLELTLV